MERPTAITTKNREVEEGPQLEERCDKHLLIHILFSLYCLKVKTFITSFISKCFQVVLRCLLLLFSSALKIDLYLIGIHTEQDFEKIGMHSQYCYLSW